MSRFIATASTGDCIVSCEKGLNGGCVRVTRSNGEIALSKTYRDAMISSVQISDDGRLCCYETDISPREAADQRLFIFDVETGKKIASFGVAGIFGHGALPDIARLTHDEVFFDIGGHVFGVSFKGEIVDKDSWNEYRLSEALEADYGYSAYYLSFEMEPARALELLKVSIGKKLESKFPAKVYRRIGEVYEELGDLTAAISNYEAALAIDPKVGIKKRLAALKKD